MITLRILDLFICSVSLSGTSRPLTSNFESVSIFFKGFMVFFVKISEADLWLQCNGT